MNSAGDFSLFLGHFHPVLVHLPIGFLLLLGALELLSHHPRFRQANAGTGVILGLSVLTALATVLAGWLLAGAGGYDENLLCIHRWTGVGVAVACALTWILWQRAVIRAYRFSLFLTVALVGASGHFGGSLTHGSDFLTKHAPAFLRRWMPASPAGPNGGNAGGQSAKEDLFAGHVQPVFTKYCAECHGPEKAKGGLRLDSHAGVLKGGANGPIVLPGKPDESVLVGFMRLPVNEADHMPPQGKPQPSETEVGLVAWWVQLGAPAAKAVKDLQPPANLKSLFQSSATPASAPPVHPAIAPQAREAALATAAKLAEEMGVVISPLAENEPWLLVNAGLAKADFGDAQLAQLTVLGPNVRWLDLAGTAVTDAGLAALDKMPHLTRLHLQRTKLTDAGLRHVGSLAELEYLNLVGTAVTDAGLAGLRSLSKLRQVYLWQTQVTENGARALTDSRVDKQAIAQWKEEVALLQDKIASQRMTVDLGVIVTNLPATNATATNMVATATLSAAVNTVCPISGKPVDPSKTTMHGGKVIAFCCDNCKAAFEKDPAPYLAKLSETAAK